MEVEYQIILGMYAFNWAVSLAGYGRQLRFDNLLGVWMIIYMVTVIGILISLGDVWWKHTVLIVYAVFVVLGTLSAMFTKEPIEMRAGHIIMGLLTAPIFLWLLLS